MTRFDLTPLMRSSVGFDHFARMVEQALDGFENTANSYPPYNIEKIDENNYRITMAVAGFALEDLDITQHQNSLIVRGERKDKAETEKTVYLHRGIAERSFERRFQLADYVEVTSAEMDNGLLHIGMVRNIPEKMKPRKISVAGASPTLEDKTSGRKKAS